MVVLTVENVSKAYGVRTLFRDVNFGIAEGDKVGIIGVNGAGKSTLIRIVAGLEPPDEGQVSTGRDARIEFLPQEPELDEDKGALEAVLADGPREFEIVRAYEVACRELEERPADEARLARVTELAEAMERVDGWNLENEAKTILSRLGIEDLHQRVGSMSGGQQKRVALARALLLPSDLLILDEPTNHLDVDTVAWLEGYLASRQTALLLITHDRYFLDRVATVILEVADGTVYRHSGNYSAFLESRAAREANLAQREQKRAQLAKKELEWLRRGPKARTTKSKARIDRAHELLSTSYAKDESKVAIDTVESRLGRKIISLENVSKSFGDHQVLDGLTYRFTRRDRLGIIGPNGAGKSTILNLIARRLEPDAGEVEIGETVVIGYYDQQAMALKPDQRAHDFITDIAHRIPTSDGWLTATQMMELFLFDRDRQWTVIGKLSGGEKRRLYLLSILMKQPNVLLLDEPTNDLDVDTLTVLEDYLDGFDGVVVTVSHDRYFLDRTVEHLLFFEGDGQVVEVPGNYSYWEERERERQAALKAEEKLARERAQAGAPKATPVSKKEGLSYKERREFEGLEERIMAIEERLATLDEELAVSATDYERVQTLHEEKLSLESELEGAMERWAELGERA